jgi:hypothetical protein
MNPAGDFTAGHWDQKNVLLHIRVTDRIDENGKKVLVIEEIQSDWHQKGREKGYTNELPDGFKLVIAEEGQFVEPQDKEPIKAGFAVVVNSQGEVVSYAREESTALDHANMGGGRIAGAPFKNTEAWAGLAVKRMMRLAVEQGYDSLAWFPAQVHTARWGTDAVIWEKRNELGWTARNSNGDVVLRSQPFATKDAFTEEVKKAGYNFEDNNAKFVTIEKPGDYWLVSASEQRGGQFNGMNIEEMARARGELLERRGAQVKSKEALRELIAENLGRERNDRSLENLTESVWKQMQEGDSGLKEPRKEGFDLFYDKLIPKLTQGYLKKLDKTAKLEVIKIDDREVLGVKITPTLKAEIEKGLPLFQNDKQEPRGFYDRHQKLIGLLKKANVTTGLHELAHSWTQEIIEDVKILLGQDPGTLSDEQKQFLDDSNAILEWLKLDTWDQLEDKHWEQFAEGFEVYVSEGKAPSLSLKKAFQRFKMWLINFGRTALGLGVELSPEMRNVFARLFATQEQIDLAEESLNFEPIDPGTYGITGIKAEKLLQAQADARQEAENILEQKLFNDLKREKTKEWKAKRKEVRAEIAKVVGQEPVYKLLSVIIDNEMPDGTPLPEGTLGLKIWKEDLKKYDPELVKKLPRGISIKTGGVTADFVASTAGFNSGEEMLKAIAEAEKKDEKIDRLTDAKMRELHGDLLVDPEITQEAIKALHNEKKGQLLRLQMEILAEKNLSDLKEGMRRATQQVPSEKVVKEQAARVVGNRELSKLKPWEFERAEAKAAKEAGKALAKGDFYAAFEAKRTEYYNHELAKAAYDAIETQEKAQALFKKIEKFDVKESKTRDANLVNAARAVMASFDLARKGDSAIEYLSKLKRYDPDTYDAVSALVENATSNAKNYKSLTVDEFNQLHDAVRGLWDLAKHEKQIEIDGEKMELDQATKEIANQFYEMNTAPIKAKYVGEATKWEKTRMYLLGKTAALRRVESWADAVDGSHKDSVVKKLIVRPVIEATTNYRIELQVKLKLALEILQPIAKTMDDKTYYSPELGRTFRGRSALVGALLHTGNDSNLTKLIVGYGGTVDEAGNVQRGAWDAFFQRMIKEGHITKADMDAVQKIWDLLESIKPEAQKAHRAMYGYYFDEITAKEVVTPWGVYRGGYFPAIVDQMQVPEANQRQESDSILNEDNSFMFPSTGRGFAKNRVDYNRPLSVDLRMVPSHIDKVMRFVHLNPAIKQTARILFNKQVQDSINAFDPTVLQDMLIPWLQRTARQTVSIPSKGWGGKALDHFLKAVRKNTGLQTLAFNVANGFQQLTGIQLAAARVKPKAIYESLFKYLRQPGEMTNFIHEKSKFMATRGENQIFDLRKDINDIALNPSKYDSLNDQAKHCRSYRLGGGL